MTEYKVRNDIYRGLVHPIGEKPDGVSWTGFECELPGEAGQTLQLENLLIGEIWTAGVDAGGRLSFTIEEPSDFRFLSYKVEES